MVNDNNFDQQPKATNSGQKTSRELLLLSILSTATYLLIAFLIYRYVHEEPLKTAFNHGYPASTQLFIGVISGGTAAGIIGLIINCTPVSEILHDFYIVDMVSKLQLSNFDRLQLSAFAGVGEELLFRGAIQPLFGIWITSIIFIGIHGYFKFKSAGHVLFGLTMFCLSMLLGFLFDYAGLIAAMTAHAVYDLIMLRIIRREE